MRKHSDQRSSSLDCSSCPAGGAEPPSPALDASDVRVTESRTGSSSLPTDDRAGFEEGPRGRSPGELQDDDLCYHGNLHIIRFTALNILLTGDVLTALNIYCLCCPQMERFSSQSQATSQQETGVAPLQDFPSNPWMTPRPS